MGDEEPDKSSPPGEQSDQNREEPSHPSGKPTRKRTDEAGGGDPDSGGEAGEGSQSTGNPDSAG